MTDDKRYKMHIIMLGGHNLVQSKPLPKQQMRRMMNEVDAGLDTAPHRSRLLEVETSDGTYEYIVIHNIATISIRDVDTDEDDGTLLVDRVSSRPPLR